MNSIPVGSVVYAWAKALFWTEARAQKVKGEGEGREGREGGDRGKGRGEGDNGELRGSGRCGQNTNLFIGVHTCKEMATV